MKALMFGWEFPPHILGGLGTASFGLTRGMAMQPDMDITFCIPKPWGDEDQSFLKIVGVNQVPIVWKDVDREYVQQRVSKAGMNADQYYKYRDHIYADFSYRHVTDLGCLEFSGRYPDNLLEEINNYSIVAGVIARTEEYDIIHAHDWLTYYAGIAAKRVSGKPLVVHMHATEFDRSGENVNQQVYNIERAGMAAADRVIAVSNLTRNIVINKYGIAPDRVVAVHNAVRFASQELEAEERGVDDKIVTFLGRITYQKGPDYFVEAAAKVLKRLKNVRFVMAGSGDMLNHVIRRVAKLGIADRFHFTGFLKGDEVQRMFALSDVYVMPSVSEPFGISPLEAMKSNVPVIISKQSGVAEVLDYAIKVDYWDVDALADAIYGLVKYPALAEMSSKKGRHEATNLRWEDAATEIINVYESVL